MAKPFQSFLQFPPCPPDPCIPGRGEEVSSELQLHRNIALGEAGSAQPLLPLPKNKTPMCLQRGLFQQVRKQLFRLYTMG